MKIYQPSCSSFSFWVCVLVDVLFCNLPFGSLVTVVVVVVVLVILYPENSDKLRIFVDVHHENIFTSHLI